MKAGDTVLCRQIARTITLTLPYITLVGSCFPKQIPACHKRSPSFDWIPIPLATIKSWAWRSISSVVTPHGDVGYTMWPLPLTVTNKEYQIEILCFLLYLLWVEMCRFNLHWISLGHWNHLDIPNYLLSDSIEVRRWTDLTPTTGLVAMGTRVYFGSTPHRVTVTTRIFAFLVQNPYRPSLGGGYIQGMFITKWSKRFLENPPLERPSTLEYIIEYLHICNPCRNVQLFW